MTLRQLAKEISDRKHSKVPEHCRPVVSFKESSSGELTKSVIAFLRLKGHYAKRLSSEGRYRPGDEVTNVLGHKISMKGSWISGSNTGMPDVISVLSPKGLFAGWEIKFGKDRQGPDQKAFEDQVKKAGGLYFIVKTWDGFIFDYNNLKL